MEAIKVNSIYKKYEIKNNGSIELTFQFAANDLITILTLLPESLNIYRNLKLLSAKKEEELGLFKVYQFRVFETGEVIIDFRSDITQVNLEKFSKLSIIKPKIILQIIE